MILGQCCKLGQSLGDARAGLYTVWYLRFWVMLEQGPRLRQLRAWVIVLWQGYIIMVRLLKALVIVLWQGYIIMVRLLKAWVMLGQGCKLGQG